MTQVDIIRKQLLEGNTLTQRSALLDFGIMALPRRVADLRETGFPVKVEMKTNPHTGQRYASYAMNDIVTNGKDLVPNCVYKMVDVINPLPFSRRLVSRSQGYMKITSVNKDGEFTCMMSGIIQVHSNMALEVGMFKLKYIGGMN
jgi:hypothetical protein